MSEIKSTNKYHIRRRYKTIGGVSYPMDEYEVILIEADSEDCGYIRPQYQWSATTGYLCDFETYTKYRREVKMVSYDSGVTWSVANPLEERRGEVIAYDSYDCGKPMYRCVDTGERVCVDNGDDWKLKIVSSCATYDCQGNPISDTIPCGYDTILSSGETHSFPKDCEICHDYVWKKVTSGNMGDCVTEIASSSFSGYSSMSSLTIGNYVEKIGDYVFRDCNSLANTPDNRLVVPRSVRELGIETFRAPSASTVAPTMHLKLLWKTQDEIPPYVVYAYSDRSGIKSATVPYNSLMEYHTYPKVGVTSGGTTIYYDSWGQLNSIFQEDYTTMEDGWKMSATVNGITYYLGTDGSNTLGKWETRHMKYWNDFRTSNNDIIDINDVIDNIEISENVLSIENESLYRLFGLKSLTLPNTLTEVTSGLCNFCTSLSSVTLGSNITTLQRSAFDNCSGLTNINLSNITKIGESVFSHCSGLTSVNLPNVEEIGYQAFAYSGLKNITIGTRATKIGGYAFNNCRSLESVTILATTPPELIGSGNFSNTNNDFIIYVPCESLDSYITASGWSVYADRMIGISPCEQEMAIVEYLSDGSTFVRPCYNNTSITSGMVKSNIVSAVIGDCVTSIGGRAFFTKQSLTSITIGSGVTSIGSGAFSSNDSSITSLTSVTIHATTPPTLGDNSFGYNRMLKFYVPCESLDLYRSTSVWSSIKNNIFGIEPCNDKVLLTASYTNGETWNATVGQNSGSTVIDSNALSILPYDTGYRVVYSAITITDNATEIGAEAFKNKESISSITISNSITSIGDKAFYYCDNLTSIDIPNSVTTIGGSAFTQCKRATSITIGSGITSIGARAFSNCNALTSFTIHATTPPILGMVAFAQTNNVTIYVPAASLDAYKSAWSSYASIIQPIPTS